MIFPDQTTAMLALFILGIGAAPLVRLAIDWALKRWWLR